MYYAWCPTNTEHVASANPSALIAWQAIGKGYMLQIIHLTSQCLPNWYGLAELDRRSAFVSCNFARSFMSHAAWAVQPLPS